ncbi:hypothetical protein BDR07DRAFT_1615584 [Suillus spraguei]|nr:hypothetical protein BDR07DRAFT_1615584 [Suillus spraguei]
MSNMIPPGNYRISNVRYPNRYVCMSGNKEFVANDAGNIIQVIVTDQVQHLVNLFDTVTSVYIGVDKEDNKVKGYPAPRVLQLSSDDGKKFEIHAKDENNVWVLNDDGNWTYIVLEPAPDSNKKYWTFENVE